MKNQLLKLFLAAPVFCALFIASPIFSTISSIQQLGLSFGDIGDPESDTLMVNPAYGNTVKNTRLSSNFFNGQDYRHITCSESGFCRGDQLYSTSFLDLHYIQPITSNAGFFINATPLLRNLFNRNGTDEAYFSVDAATGAWYKFFDKLTLGFSGKYFSKQMGSQTGYLSQTERILDMYLFQAGLSFDVSDKWNIGYSLEYIQNKRILSITSSLDFTGYRGTYIYPFIYTNSEFLHDLFVRGEFNDVLSLDNHVRLAAGLEVASTLKVKTKIAMFLFGLNYYYYNLKFDQNNNYENHYAGAFTGANIYLFSWLDLRLAMRFLDYSNHYNIISFDPRFNGGVLIKFTDTLHFETQLSDINFGNIVPISLNFQLSYTFNK